MIPKIVLVDDDRNFLKVLTQQIEDFGFHPYPFSSVAEALAALQAERFDLVITDLRMPEGGGMHLLRAVREMNELLPVLVLTAFGSIERAVEATKLGAFNFLTKPFDFEELRVEVRNALKVAFLTKENAHLQRAVQEKFKFEGILGISPAFRKVLALAQQLAPVDTTVLIQGESGTGKELMARAIHFNSHRRAAAFVVVNCGAIPEDLIESELFGHKRGAFTGAETDQIGKFEAADRGTVFLDEIGELPLRAQVKLLRVLQQKEIDVVGASQPSSVDVRILAASNKDLQEAMGQGEFREDLFYRLSVAPLDLPPLRDRPEDIPLLSQFFLEKFNREIGKSLVFAEDALEVLSSLEWPGNVRELENLVHRLVIFGQDGVIDAGKLPPGIRSADVSVGDFSLQIPEEGISMHEVEKKLLQAALEKAAWNQTRAASLLKITRNTLIYRMQKHGIRPPGEGTAEL